MVLKVLFEQSYFTSSTSKCENCRLRIRCRDSNPRPITLYARLNPSQGNVLISFGLIISRVIDRLASPIFSFFKCANPGHFLFIFVHFKHKFYRKNCRRQQDSNSDHRSRKPALWPLDHHHAPYYLILSNNFVVNVLFTKIKFRRNVAPLHLSVSMQENDFCIAAVV